MKAAKPTPVSEPTAQPVTDEAAMNRDVDAHAGRNGQAFEIDGTEFTIRPMKVKQFFPFLSLARPLLSALASRPAPDLPPASPDQGGSILDPSTAAAMADGEWILGLLEQHGPTIIEALAIGTAIERAALEELTVVDLVVVLKHFVLVNAGFFASQGLKLPQNPLGQFAGGQVIAASPPSN